MKQMKTVTMKISTGTITLKMRMLILIWRISAIEMVYGVMTRMMQEMGVMRKGGTGITDDSPLSFL
jgi:hypothetical protein